MKLFIKYCIISFLTFTVFFTPAILLYDRYIGNKISEAAPDKQQEIPDEVSSLPCLVEANNPFFDDIKNQDRVNILIYGLGDKMTDTIMVASFDMENKFVDLISVPRDTRYERTRYKEGPSQKINAIYASEGFEAFAKAVSDVLIGMPINYYMEIEYDGVKKIVDSMGGVPMDIKKDMKYKDLTPGYPPLIIDIKKGEQVLDGEHAVQFLRYRSGYREGDLGRIDAQHEFMKSAMNQALGLRLPIVATTIINNVKTDIGLTTAVKFAGKAIGTDPNSLESHQLPGDGKMYKGLSFVYPDAEKTKELMEEIYSRPGLSETGQEDAAE